MKNFPKRQSMKEATGGGSAPSSRTQQVPNPPDFPNGLNDSLGVSEPTSKNDLSDLASIFYGDEAPEDTNKPR